MGESDIVYHKYEIIIPDGEKSIMTATGLQQVMDHANLNPGSKEEQAVVAWFMTKYLDDVRLRVTKVE